MKGLVTIDFVKHIKGKDDRLRKKGHNTISNGALSFIASNGLSQLFNGNSCVGGDKVSFSNVSAMHRIYNSNGYTEYLEGVATKDFGLGCCALGVNLNTLADVTSKNSFLPVYRSGGAVDVDAIRAVSNTVTSATATRSGSAKPNGESVVNTNRNGKRYSFPGGTGTGNLTGIAMMPATFVPGNVPNGGFITYTQLDDIDQFTDKSQGSTLLVPPGIDGLGLKVRMNYTDKNSVAVHTRDLVTGEVVDGGADTWFPTSDEMASGALYEDAAWIFALHETYSSSTHYFYVRQYSKSTHAYTEICVGTIPVSYNGSKMYARFCVDADEHPYVVVCYAGGGAIFNAQDAYQTTRYTNKGDFAAALSSTLGITVPADWVTDSNVVSFCAQKVGDYIALIAMINKKVSGYNDDYVYEAYITNDKTNVINNLVDVIPLLNLSDIVWGVGVNVGVIRIGRCLCQKAYAYNENNGSRPNVTPSQSYGYTASEYTPAIQGIEIVGVNNCDKYRSGSGENFIENAVSGAFIAFHGMFSTWLSMKKFDDNQSKTSDVDMFVQYDYEFTSTGQTPEE